MLRFAFSPTTDMQLGTLRLALFNYLLAQQKGENLLVRVEDINKDKNIAKKDQEGADLLHLFKIEYTQLIHQSQNLKFHAAMALQLLHEKKAFSCFCSDEWLDKKRQEAAETDKKYMYDDACRNLPAELVIDNTAPFTIRIVRPQQSLVVHDLIEGRKTFQAEEFDSFIIMNQDKSATDDFATAIDDMLNDISVVVCNKDQLHNSAKQVHIRNQLGYDKEIAYAHITNFTEEISVVELLKEGYLPEAISNYLILIGNETPCDFFTLQEAKEWFNVQKLTTDSPTLIFDKEKLKKINKEYLLKMDATELSRYVGFADAEIGELARIYLQEADTTQELKAKIAPIFEKRVIPKHLENDVEIVKDIIIGAPYFEEYTSFSKYIKDNSSFSDAKIEEIVRFLLTNSEDGPNLVAIYRYLKNYIGEIIK